MLNKKMWNIFKNTGDVQAYLYYKEHNSMVKNEEEYQLIQTLQAEENSKVNSI